MKICLVCLVLTLPLIAAVNVASKVDFGKCHMPADGSSLYPPLASTTLEWITIDLSKAPADRWTEAVVPRAAGITAMIMELINLFPEPGRDKFLAYVSNHSETIVSNFPLEYGDEIRGIAKATGIGLDLLVLINIAYEIEGGCTSIVAQDLDGNVFHARNLDFGLFFGWDHQNKTWKLAELLRPLLFNAKFVDANGIELYRSTVFAGYVGLLTGMKTGAFSITVDTRFDSTLWSGLYKWFDGDHTGKFLSFTTRLAIETANTFEEAWAILNNTVMIGPGYIILGGLNAGEGTVFTRAEALSLRPYNLSAAVVNGSFFILETNYDWWVKAPFFDDRVDPAEACLSEVQSKNVGFASLFTVLSSQPNLNLLTTYTTLMQVKTGKFEAYTQNCIAPHCTPW